MVRIGMFWGMAIVICSPHLWADTGFRVETKVYLAEEEAPMSESLTLFLDGAAYDFLDRSEQVAIYLPKRGQQAASFVLLDVGRGVRTDIDTERLEALLDKTRKRGADHPNSLVAKLVAPDFDQTFDPAQSQLTLESAVMRYEVTTRSQADSAQAESYLAFCGNFAKLNFITREGMPPFARLELNAALARRRLLPAEVRLVMMAEGLDVRAQHDYTWRLSKQDRQRIDRVLDQMETFRRVENQEFLGAKTTARQ